MTIFDSVAHPVFVDAASVGASILMTLALLHTVPQSLLTYTSFKPKLHLLRLVVSMLYNMLYNKLYNTLNTFATKSKPNDKYTTF